ncbi:MAG: hypothetical protein ACJASB_000483 [Shewanella psychromarinicola]|jgi:hypothetical protein
MTFKNLCSIVQRSNTKIHSQLRPSRPPPYIGKVKRGKAKGAFFSLCVIFTLNQVTHFHFIKKLIEQDQSDTFLLSIVDTPPSSHQL